MDASALLHCRCCGQLHSPAPLPRGARWLCASCGTLLARRSRWGSHAPLAFAATATILAVPAVLLPFASVSKLGAPRVTHVYDGAGALWDHGLPFLASWVVICAVLGPAVLAVSLLVALASAWRRGASSAKRLAERLAHALHAWSMPEVHVLAVLVSFVRIETLADVTLGPGFWCYAAMAIALVAAARSFRFEPAPR